MKYKTLFNLLKYDGFSFSPAEDMIHFEFVHEGAHVKSEFPAEYWTNVELLAVTLLETPMAKQKLGEKTLRLLMGVLDRTA